MLALSLFPGDAPVRRVLAIGCHADDIEIGCGGTLLALTRSRPDVEVTWVVLGADGERAGEARASAKDFLADAARFEVVVHGFKDAYMPYYGESVKEAFEQLKPAQPDLVLTHTRDDLHQDHRLACELTWNTFRDHLILEYEVPKWDGDLGRPNLYVPLDDDVVADKLDLVAPALPDSGGEALVRRRDVPGAHAAPRARVRRTVAVRGGLLCSEVGDRRREERRSPDARPGHREPRLHRLGPGARPRCCRS